MLISEVWWWLCLSLSVKTRQAVHLKLVNVPLCKLFLNKDDKKI